MKMYTVENWYFQEYWFKSENDYDKVLAPYLVFTTFGQVNFDLVKSSTGRLQLDNIKFSIPYIGLPDSQVKRLFNLVWGEVVGKFETIEHSTIQ